MWVLTSRRRLLSLTAAPSGWLSFLGSGFEDAVLMLCFLEGLSWFAAKKTKERVNCLERGAVETTTTERNLLV